MGAQHLAGQEELVWMLVVASPCHLQGVVWHNHRRMRGSREKPFNVGNTFYGPSKCTPTNYT